MFTNKHDEFMRIEDVQFLFFCGIKSCTTAK